MITMTSKARQRAPGGGLEKWLEGAIEAGSLMDLPLYYPLRERRGRPAEPFARALLARMQSARGDCEALEFARDDSRAFRSWAEKSPARFDRS